MMSWLPDLVVQAGVIAAAAVGLSLHLRLVRFFDLGWALWVMLAAFVGVHVARESASVTLGVISGGIVGAFAGLLEDGVLLRRVLASAVPREVLERVSFTAAVGAYLALISTADVLGFRDQAMMPATDNSWLGVSAVGVVTATVSWTFLILLGILRVTRIGSHIRAALDNPIAYLLFGFRLPIIAAGIGGIAGALTGVAASSFGLLYFAHYSTGLTLMLIAVIPYIVTGMKSSTHVLIAATVVVAAIAIVRFAFGYTASEFAVYGTILLLLLLKPHGLGARLVREV